MANFHETKIILNYESENITIIHDLANLINYFIKFVHAQTGFEENIENAFVFSDKNSFDCCVEEATAIGLLPA